MDEKRFEKTSIHSISLMLLWFLLRNSLLALLDALFARLVPRRKKESIHQPFRKVDGLSKWQQLKVVPTNTMIQLLWSRWWWGRSTSGMCRLPVTHKRKWLLWRSPAGERSRRLCQHLATRVQVWPQANNCQLLPKLHHKFWCVCVCLLQGLYDQCLHFPVLCLGFPSCVLVYTG